MDNGSIVDVLIKNIKEDQQQLEESQKQIDEAKEAKRVVVDRLKDYRKDISVLLKYADEEQIKKIERLGFDLSESSRGLNSIASSTLDIIMNAKGNSLTNGELYDAYVKGLKKKEDAVNYTEFNIKCRSLFNTHRLLRKKGSDPMNTREDAISLNKSVHNETTKK